MPSHCRHVAGLRFAGRVSSGDPPGPAGAHGVHDGPATGEVGAVAPPCDEGSHVVAGGAGRRGQGQPVQQAQGGGVVGDEVGGRQGGDARTEVPEHCEGVRAAGRRGEHHRGQQQHRAHRAATASSSGRIEQRRQQQPGWSACSRSSLARSCWPRSSSPRSSPTSARGALQQARPRRSSRRAGAFGDGDVGVIPAAVWRASAGVRPAPPMAVAGAAVEAFHGGILCRRVIQRGGETWTVVAHGGVPVGGWDAITAQDQPRARGRGVRPRGVAVGEDDDDVRLGPGGGGGGDPDPHVGPTTSGKHDTGCGADPLGGGGGGVARQQADARGPRPP